MKLYATVASERATKGQGGNDRLEIDIFMGSAKNSVKIIEGSIRKEGEGYTVYITTLGQGDREQCIDTFIKEKGEKQKGERVECSHCLRFVYPEEDNTCRYCDHTL